MKYCLEDPGFKKFEEDLEDENNPGLLLVFSPGMEISRTEDCVNLLKQELGGKWKRVYKKTFKFEYCEDTYRVFENKDSGQIVTVYQVREGVCVSPVDFRQHLDKIDQVIKFCQHFVSEDETTVFYNPILNRLFFEIPDGGVYWVNDTKNAAEIMAVENCQENGESINFEDPKYAPENSLNFLGESLYADESGPDDRTGFMVIYKTKRIDQLKEALPASQNKNTKPKFQAFYHIQEMEDEKGKFEITFATAMEISINEINGGANILLTDEVLDKVESNGESCEDYMVVTEMPEAEIKKVLDSFGFEESDLIQNCRLG